MSRIAVVDLSFTWPPDGGARVDVREIVLRLARQHDVRLFVPELKGWLSLGSDRWIRWPLDRTRFFWKGKVDRDVGFPVTRVPFGPLSFGAKEIGLRFRRVIEEWKPDQVFIADGWYLKPHVILAFRDYRPVVRIYAHEMLCLKGNGFFYRWGKACDRNYLNGKTATHLRCVACTTTFYASYPSPTWIHEFLTSRAFRPGYVKLVQEALEASRTVVVYNQFTADRVRPFAKDVRIIPSGVDAEHFRPGQANGRNEAKKVILAMGRTEEPRKGVSTLLAAAALLRRERDDFEVWLTDRKTKGPEWVRHIGWHSFDQMPNLYRSTDIAVVPSLWPEPQGIVAVEAMACGVPLVVSRIGGLREICRDGVEGFHVEPGDASDLAAKLRILLSDAELRRRMGESGRSRVEKEYRWDHIVDTHVAPLFAGETKA